jgi:hypothetical protein
MAQTLNISWTAPTGGQLVTGYTIDYKKHIDTLYTKITGVTGTNYVLSGLTENTIYDVCVQSNCTPNCISEMTMCVTGVTNYDIPPTATPTPTPTVTATPTVTPTSTGLPPTFTPTPTPTATVSVDSGLCYTFTLQSSSFPSGWYLRYVPIGSSQYINVYSIQSYDNGDGSYTFYFCSMSTPYVYDGSHGAQDVGMLTGGSCSSDSNCAPGQPVITPTPTPTATPVYYYYLMGDCSFMTYTTVIRQSNPFGASFSTTACMTDAQINEFYQHIDWGTQTLTTDYTDPCGFDTGYTPTFYARSTNPITEGTVYNFSGNCYSVVATRDIPGSYTFNLDGKTPQDSCSSCLALNYTGFTWYQYTAQKCGTTDGVYVYSIFPYNPSGSIFNFNNGEVYYLAVHDLTGAIVDKFCATITGYIGEYTGPGYPDGIGGHFPVGALTCAGPYSDCSASDCVTGRTDCIEITAGSSGTSGSSGSSGGVSNVTSISVTINNTTPNTYICGYDGVTEYTTYTYNTTFTFKDSSGNPVTPNQPVTYRIDTVNDGVYGDFGVTGSTKTIDLEDKYQLNNCSGEQGYTEVIKIKVGGVLLLTYVAGTVQ